MIVFMYDLYVSTMKYILSYYTKNSKNEFSLNNEKDNKENIKFGLKSI